MKNLIKKLFWILTDRCRFCGGKIETGDFEIFNCSECGKNQ